MSENYSLLLNMALSQYNVDLLIEIWSLGSKLNKDSFEQRKIILDNIENLRRIYGIPSNDNISFRKFVRDYDEMIYDIRKDSNNNHLVFYARKGNMRNIKMAIEKGAND